jgi:putative spermidine/putrescine transport system substrate-binding protein
MNGCRIFLSGILFSLLVLAFAQDKETKSTEASDFREDFLADKLTWEQVLERAKAEGTVRWYHWGGSEELNIWIDTVVKPDLAELGITLETTRLSNTRDGVDLVLADKAAGRGAGQGVVDAIWINGENFYTLSSQGLNFGSFADKLPNSRYFQFDPSLSASGPNLYDFGYPTNKEELPWSGDQYVCFIDSARLEQAPQDFAELEAFLRANPGRFTYIRPPQFNGNTFVQSVLYALNPDQTSYEPFQKSAEELGAEEFVRLSKPGFDYLKRLEPFLLGGGGSEGERGSPIYPEDDAALEAKFVNGEIDMACRFGFFNTATKIETGAFPETARNIIFPKEGMIKNKNFIGIPLSSPNPAAALVLANYLASPENQLSKLETIGYPLGVDPELLSEGEQAAALEVAPDLMGLTFETLADVTVPDTNASLVDIIETVWTQYIEQASSQPFEDIVLGAFQN